MESKINVIKFNENAVIPTYGTEFAAGADLYAVLDEPIAIKPEETVLIGTGIGMQIPEGYAGFVYARSGLSTKKGLAPANKVGVIDADYRGEIKVALYNQSNEIRIVEPGERIAQIVVAPFLKCEFNLVEKLDESVRGENAFGSTGNK